MYYMLVLWFAFDNFQIKKDVPRYHKTQIQLYDKTIKQARKTKKMNSTEGQQLFQKSWHILRRMWYLAGLFSSQTRLSRADR